MDSGLKIFKDFDLPTAPLFVYLNYIFYPLFKNNYLILKYVGVLLNSSLFIIIYLILKRYFNFKVAILATILASFIYITSPVYAAHDYHVLVDIFVLISVYLLLTTNDISLKIYQFFGSFLAGIFVSALFLQNRM